MSLTKQREAREAFKRKFLEGDDSALGEMERGAHIIELGGSGRGSAIEYDPKANPIITAFHTDRISDIKALWSPYGSGTTSALVYEFLVAYPLLSVLPNVKPDKDGVYRVYLQSGIMRATLRDLIRGFLRTADMMTPPDMGVAYHSAKTALVHKKVYNNFMGKKVEVSGQIDFISLDRQGAEGQIPSLTVDMVGVNEPGVLKWELIEKLEDRAGRFNPSTNPRLVIREGNPPDKMNPGYASFGGLPSEAILGTGEPRIFGMKDESEDGYCQTHYREVTMKDGTIGKKRARAWWYPGGDSEFAANRHNLPDGYYDNMKARGISYRAPNLYGIPSIVTDGQPVFDCFSEATHIDRSPLVQSEQGDQHFIVYDCDTTAGAIICRRRKDGGWLIVGTTECKKRSPERFAMEIVAMCRNPALNIRAWGNSEWMSDPAGSNDAPRTNVPFYVQVQEVVNKELRISKKHEPLPWVYQDPRGRYEAANYILNRAAPGSGKPFIMVHSSAMNMAYALGAYTFKDPEKYKFDKSNNNAATFGDCFQYLCQVLSARGDWKGEPEGFAELDKDLANQKNLVIDDPLSFDAPPLF